MNPYFTGTPRQTMVTATVAVTIDGAGAVSLITGLTSGTAIVGVWIKGTGNSTAGMQRFFKKSGAAVYVYDEVAVAATTIGATTAAYSALWVPPQPLVLASGETLQAGPHNAETYVYHCAAGDY